MKKEGPKHFRYVLLQPIAVQITALLYSGYLCLYSSGLSGAIIEIFHRMPIQDEDRLIITIDRIFCSIALDSFYPNPKSDCPEEHIWFTQKNHSF
jgi:hypothetical protein